MATFPLGPLCALLNNLVEIRTDAYKLCTSYQRPPAFQGQDIGSWENVLQGLGAMAVITNAFIVSFSSSWVQNELQSFYISQGLESTDSQILAGRLLIVIIFEVGGDYALEKKNLPETSHLFSRYLACGVWP